MSERGDGIIVASPWDLTSARSWSGVVLPMMDALRAEFSRVEVAPISTETALLDRAVSRMQGARGLAHLPSWSPPTTHRRSRSLVRALEALPAHLPIVAIAATPELVDVPATRRILQITDSSFASLAATYPDFQRVPASDQVKARRTERQVAMRTESFVVATRWSKDRLVEDVGVPATRVHVAHFGPAIAATADDASDERQPPERDQLRLLFVASDWERKGGDVALAAVTELRRRGHDIGLTVVGEVDRDLPAFVRRAGRLDRSAMSRAYLSHDALLEPTRASAGGVVVTDALHHGLPVIASAIGGQTDLVVDGRTGWLVVDDGTPTPFIRVVEDRILHSEFTHFSRAALTWARGNASWGTWARAVRAALDDPTGGQSDSEVQLS
ncbi:hypothetical protein GCM10028787_07610 [Brachybacterium horti]